EAKPGLSPDGAGFVAFTLAEPPVPGSLEITWAVSRETSVSSGTSATSAGTAYKATAAGTTKVRYLPTVAA
ncbi:hypothetical protein, partial [Thauera butanivorans]|uniref:hypothetical protein n=1 Tax=Thauera butanivorans TaxID=86174 RepID=UPI000A7CC868